MEQEKVQLIDLTGEMQEAYLDFVYDFRDAGEKFTPVPYEDFDVAAHLHKLRNYAEGIDLPSGYVPCNVYWLVRGGRIIGECSIRHRLTENSRDFGGHVGYSVRPSERNKGYATLMLKLVLQKARELGIPRMLVTCAKDNLASARVIEKNGGALDSESYSEQGGRVTQRYWIDL